MIDPRNVEPLANYELAKALQRRNPDWHDGTVHAERTRVIQQLSLNTDSIGKRPDILIAHPRRQPVIVETEFAPAPTVEEDAISRLGAALRTTGTNVEGVLSVELSDSLRTGDLAKIENTRFNYAMHYLNASGASDRWPPKPTRLSGAVDDLADAIEYLSLSERHLALGSATLEEVVRNTSSLMSEHLTEDSLIKISRNLHQSRSEQTDRMAAAILVSAFVFHAAIEGQERIPPVPIARHITKGSLLNTWDLILDINYWPVFSIARDLIREFPVRSVPPIMDRIAEAVSDLVQLGATTYHDLTGRMFQTLIADRKFLATFYTLAESACLLAELALARIKIDWSDRDSIERLRIADFACGTGALLSATQRAIYRRYRRAGGDDKELHKTAMESVLIGADIMPAASHLTCSMLSSAHPSIAYGKSQIHTMPYGVHGLTTHIGALDLLVAENVESLFTSAEAFGGTEFDSRKKDTISIEDGSCDLIIMNPPFTRPTNHEASHSQIPNPAFAGFGTSGDEQRAMSRVLRSHTAEFGSGHAGLASNFMDLCHRKLKRGGVLALVLPFTFTRGKAWEASRTALSKNYTDIHILSIAATGQTERAFSADTGIAECLVVATKSHPSNRLTKFNTLTKRPTSLLQAAVLAKHARRQSTNGDLLDAGMAGVISNNLIETVLSLTKGELTFRRQSDSINLKIVPLKKIANRGLVDREIGNKPTSGPRNTQGAFDILPNTANEIPTYPAIWAHDANKERRLVVNPDTRGRVRMGMQSEADQIWLQTASRLHSNRDFRLNSQSLAMCITPEKCLGGRAWPNVLVNRPIHEIPLLLWCNSTLGLILFWWISSRQQAGRSVITISKLPTLPVLDLNSLTKDQLAQSHSLFNEFSAREFLPANEAYHDVNRKELDNKLLFGKSSILRLDRKFEEGLDLLRRQWCAEPSVHGGKSTRIRA